MRYPTVGDFLYRLGIDRFNFIIAEMGNTDYEMLIFWHECKEAYLCWKAGIKEEDITAFDIMFELERAKGLHSETDEPGDDSRAPYFSQHQLAGKSEKIFCKELGIPWKKYDNAVKDLEE